MTTSSSHSSSNTLPLTGTGGCPFTLTLAILGPEPVELALDRRLLFGSNGGKGGMTKPPGVEGGSDRSPCAAEGDAPAGPNLRAEGENSPEPEGDDERVRGGGVGDDPI